MLVFFVETLVIVEKHRSERTHTHTHSLLSKKTNKI